MSLEAITQFLDLTQATGELQGRYQNGVSGDPIAYEGNHYPYLSFIYQGATRSRTGDNLISGLAVSSNQVSTNLITEAVVKKWSVRVRTVLMNPDTMTPETLLSDEIWVAASMGYDAERVEVQLSSAIDAIGLDAPFLRLTQSQVGALPLTSSISNW